MKRKNLLVAFVSIFTLLMFFSTNEIKAQKERSDIPEKYKWDLTDLFPSDEAWEKAKEELKPELNKIESFKGKLTSSAADLLACLEFSSGISKQATLLYIYASMNSDLDTRVMKYSGMEKELQQLFSDFSAKAAFVNPEILSVEWSVIEGFIKEEPKLEVYRQSLKDLFRGKEHTLGEKEERIMALTGLISGAPASIYSTFSDAEMPNPKVTLSTGEEVTLSSAGYSKHRAAPNREDRILVFETFWENYKKYEASFGEMLYGNVKTDVFSAKARNYESSLEAALFQNNIPVDVYYSLVENVNKNLPAFHRYLEIKKRMLGVDTLKYLDLYAPVVKDVDLNYTYDEGKALILKAFKPLGEEYISTVQKGFDERWIDVYPTTGKRSGAYSNGAAYDKHPYILLNYNDKYDDVSTLAHELGHTMHSYFSNKTQPYPTSDYPIFVAEVASTFNEVLLFNETMKTVKDDDVRLSLLMNWLDGFKGTLFRQTQFAEFELRIHEAAEKGEPLTGEFLSKTYKGIVDSYYGHKENICFVDDYIEMEWAYIPHFYYNFYVYQYSTSFTASMSLAKSVMDGKEGALESYMKFISSGGSDYPIELLKKAGVDMTTSDPFDNCIKSMNAVMDEIEKILDKKGK
ncbi:MAG: oligoendopeptidase F [Bacteroidales bacterium]|nr:oligoendopeptidase F [Bacteroidales bacterium]MBN2820824.1 oligoendopeptidase F [Bacteroidales bacterium]